MSTELAQSTPQTVKDFLALPAYKARFGEVLGARAPQFMASLVAISSQSNLANCEPRSVIASAMVAATLDLPIEKSLGFAHVVPYGNVAQFQMAAKGYVQLALRSAQYQRMNAKPINAEAFDGYDEVGEPRINWELLDETKPAIGYVVAWKLTNGFTKIAYWTKTKVEAHAAQFSQAFKKKKMDSPWFTNFDKMALKTVVMNELRSWGILSVQMQTALRHDMASQKDVDSEPEYVDGDTVDISSDANPQAEQQARPAPPPRKPKGANAAKETAAQAAAIDVTITAAPAETAAAPEPAKPAAPTVETDAPEPAESAPVAKQSRAFLKDKEEIIAQCKVEKVTPLWAKKEGIRTPSVQVQVSGEFVGLVLHVGGAAPAAKPEDDPIPAPEWKPGNAVTLSLLGRQQKDNTVRVFVQKVAAEGAPDTAMEVS